MFFSSTSNAALSVLLTFGLLGVYTGESNGNLSGVSPFFHKLERLEEGFFQKVSLERRSHDRDYHIRVKGKIQKVISQYKTGLKNDARSKIPQAIIHASQKYGYDPLFLTAVIVAESSFYNWAKSNQGAMGLMQVRLPTGHAMATEAEVQWKGKPTLYDPKANIALGAHYLDKMVQRFGDLALALEAYNHGPTQIDRYLRKGYRPKRYSQKVFQHYSAIRQSI